MITNQAAVPRDFLPEHMRCTHAPGRADETTCAYLRALGRLRAWVDRAEDQHQLGQGERRTIGELWRILAEVASALDQCPNLQAQDAGARETATAGPPPTIN